MDRKRVSGLTLIWDSSF